MPTHPILMTDATKDWGNRLKGIADVVGPELAVRLILEHGGVEYLYIPKLTRRAGFGHPFAAILGDELFRKFCKVFGGQRISVPTTFCGLKKRIILELAESTSLSHRTIARRAHCTETYVRMVLRDAGLAPKTPGTRHLWARQARPTHGPEQTMECVR
jgi:hypothetical protein